MQKSGQNVNQHASLHPDFWDEVAASADSGRVIWLKSLAAKSLIGDSGSVREKASTLGLVPLVLNPRSGHSDEQTLRGLLARYIHEIDGIEPLSEHALRLAEFVMGDGFATEMITGRARTASIGRLWTALASHLPGLLIVTNTDSLSADDRTHLKHLAHHVFVDSLAELEPGRTGEFRPRGAMVVLDDGAEVFELDPDASGVIVLDHDETSRELIRDYLTHNDTLQRFIDSFGSDVGKVTDLVNQLPTVSRNLHRARFETLDSESQQLVRVLAVAGESVGLERLRHALTALGYEEPSTSTLRALGKSGLVEQHMSQVGIAYRVRESDTASALLDLLDETRLRKIHRALAESELHCKSEQADRARVARHFVKAQAPVESVAYGLEAGKELLERGDFEAAHELFEAIEGIVSDADVASENLIEFRMLSAECASKGGYLERAVRLYTSLLDDVKGDDRVHVLLGLAKTLHQRSDYGAALENFERALESEVQFPLEVEARIGHAEARYALGRFDGLSIDLENLVVEISEQLGRDAAMARRLVEARNTLGKVAIFEGDYDKASELFEQNQRLARDWSWGDEVARAEANLGVVALQRRDHGEALSRLNRALEVADERGGLTRPHCFANLATVHQRQGNYARALDANLEALRTARSTSDDLMYSLAAFNLATIYQGLGAFEKATNLIGHLYETFGEQSPTLTRQWNRMVVGDLLKDQGRFEEALVVYEDLVGTEQFRSMVYGSEVGLRIAQCAVELGDFGRAERILDEFDPDESSNPELLAAIQRLICSELDLHHGEFDSALEKASEAGSALRRLGSLNHPVRATLVAAQALVELGRDDEARHRLEIELDAVRSFVERAPDEYAQTIWGKRFHQEMLEQYRYLNGELPEDVAASREVEPTSREVDEEQQRAWRARYSRIIGDDPKLHHIFRVIDRVADSDATVLVYGESGTGKELISEAVHEQSARQNKPFVKVNCAAFVENLLLSELFGHEKGAFTGAISQKIGRFERADGGTIFLDEIGDISANTQVALLRVLQEGTFERVGGSETLSTDVRVVCATNKDLEEMVRRGEFRLDLYYRLKGVVIDTPALRQRRQDIPKLVRHFAREADAAPKQFSEPVIRFLASYSWPGNIRELQNFVKSILLFVEGSMVEMEHVEDFREFFVSGEFDSSLPAIDVRAVSEEAPSSASAVDEENKVVELTAHPSPDPESALVEKVVREGLSLSDLKKRLEMESIKRALTETDGNITQAAELLQMKRPRLSQIINGDDELSELKSDLIS